MSSEIFAESWELACDILTSPPMLVFVAAFLAGQAFRLFFNMLFDGRPVHINWGIKDLFLKIVNKVLPFEWCYKMGWARLGIDFVECDSQDCNTCPFNGKCTSDLRASGEK